MIKCFPNIGRKLPNHTVQHPRRPGCLKAIRRKHSDHSFRTVQNTQSAKHSILKCGEVTAGAKPKIYCQETACRKCVLAALRTVELGLTKFGNQTKPVKYSENSCSSYQFRADVQTYGHRPRFTADNEAAETAVCAHKCQVTAGW
jgi:hypothetical protein